MDNFHVYLKKQLLEYVEAERQKGIPLEEIEKVLLDAGHRKNIVDEVFLELKKEKIEGKPAEQHKNETEKDLTGMLKGAFGKFMAQANQKDVKEAREDLEKTDTKALVSEVIQEAEFIEEKTTLESAAFFVYLVVLGLIVLFSAGATDSQLKNVMIGFTPAVLSIFVSFLALKLADNVPVFVFIPLVFASIFYGIARFSQFPLFRGLDPEGLAIVNFLLGFFFNIMIVYVRFLKPNHMKRRPVKRPHRTYEGINHLRE
jgi:hypothetical protein